MGVILAIEQTGHLEGALSALLDIIEGRETPLLGRNLLDDDLAHGACEFGHSGIRRSDAQAAFAVYTALC